MSKLTRACALFVIFSTLASSFWFNLLGPIGAVILLFGGSAVILTIFIRELVRSGRGIPTRQLPWFVLAYAAMAGLSIAWSAWPLVSAVTWALLALMTAHGVLMARLFTGAELLRMLEYALGAILALSVAMELWVSLVVRHPILPNFSTAPADPDAHWFWVRGNLLDSGRIQGMVGNANSLAVLCVLAMIVFATRLVQRAPLAPLRWVGLAVAVWLWIRADSAMMYVVVAVVAVVAVVVIGLRRLPSRRARVLTASALGVVALAGAAVLVIFRDQLFALLGRNDTLTGRTGIWEKVLERAERAPVFGNGFASPWLPWDPAFDGWIVDHGATVFHAHNVWIDVFFQLGAVGVILLIAVYANAAWRTARQAFSSDLAHRSMTPMLLIIVLLGQGLTESAPLTLWGWLLVTALSTLPASVDRRAVDYSGSDSSR